MSSALTRMNFDEVEYFYKSPLSLVDYSLMQSYSLIKSTIEVFHYYHVDDFTPQDIKDFFEKLQLVQAKTNRIFIPSVKKVNGVLERCMSVGTNCLTVSDGVYHIKQWDSSGYRYEMERKSRLETQK